MTQPAAPHEPQTPTVAPPIATEAPTPLSPPVPQVPQAPQGPGSPSMSAPQGTPVAPTEVGLTANGKIVAVQPWRQSTAVLAVIAQTFFVLAALANLYLAWSDVRIKGLLNDEDFSAVVREAETADGLYVPILVLAGAAGIFLLVWLHRVWTSDRSDHSLYTRGTGMAIGGWFIPFANFVLGPLALRDLLWGTEHASPLARPGRPTATPRLVSALWAVIAVNVVLGMLSRGAQSGLDRPESMDALVTSLQAALTYEALGGASGAVGGVVAILTIRKVMTYTRR